MQKVRARESFVPQEKRTRELSALQEKCACEVAIMLERLPIESLHHLARACDIPRMINSREQIIKELLASPRCDKVLRELPCQVHKEHESAK
jgi:hypothetical protein